MLWNVLIGYLVLWALWGPFVICMLLVAGRCSRAEEARADAAPGAPEPASKTEA